MSRSDSIQRNKKDKKKLGVGKLKSFTNVQICDNDESKATPILNSDCLEEIFKYLPLVDLFKVQRVCKYWRTASMNVCRRIRRLEMSRSFWGASSDKNIFIDLNVLEKVLHICGPNVHYIGLSNDEDIYFARHRRVYVECNKKLWILIYYKCPAIKSIDFGQSRSTVALKFIAHQFKNLISFKMDKFTLPRKSPLVYEEYLCDLFVNNDNLKRLDLDDVTLTTECLAKLNPANFEELTLQNCIINNSEYLVKALKALKRLKKITITRCACFQGMWINDVLEALTSISDNLVYLDFYLYNQKYEIIDSIYIGKLKNLEILCIADDTIINDDVLMVITECCKKLRKLHIYNSKSVTDMGFDKLTELKKLETLVLNELSNLTDKVLHNMVNIVNLEVRRCANFQNNGFLNLIRNSQNIRTLKIFNCKGINELTLIEEVHRCSGDNLELIIDSSDITNDYIKYIYKIKKLNNKVMKIVQKYCYNCFKLKIRENPDCSLCCNIIESNF